MYQAPGLDWLERQAEVAENLVAERQAAAKRHRWGRVPPVRGRLRRSGPARPEPERPTGHGQCL